MDQKTRIVFCLPGNSYSGEFLKNWSDVIYACCMNNIIPLLSQAYDPVVYFARNKVLGGDVMRGTDQKPFDEKLEYDYLMWIDSDIMFKFENLAKLLAWNKPIVAGIYMMSDHKHFAVVKTWDEEYFVKHGSFKFLEPSDIDFNQGLFEVAYSGLGFMLIKKGVMETLSYPWFRPIMYTMGDIQDFSSEDVSLCRLLQEKQHKIYIDPAVWVGHEKKVVF